MGATGGPAVEPPGAAIFDLDGTLVRSEERSRAVWAAFLASHQVPAEEELLDEFMGRRGRDVLAERTHLFPGHTIQELSEEVWRLLGELALPAVGIVPGAVELVRAVAAAGAPMALVTSGPRHYAIEMLDQVSLRSFFDVLVTGDDVVRGKPDPEGFVAACDRLGVQPSRAVAFEDSPAGLSAAVSAGMRCVGVTTTATAAALATAELIVTDLRAVDWPVLTDITRTREA